MALGHLLSVDLKAAGMERVHVVGWKEAAPVEIRQLVMHDIIFYYADLCKVGGVETFFCEMAEKYNGPHDMALLYRTSDDRQLSRISEYMPVIRWDGKTPIECKQAIFGYSFDLEDLDLIHAEEYIQVLHADYLALKDVMPAKIDPRFRYIAVSENNADSWEKLTGVRPEVCYNPITVAWPQKVLHLISATRLPPDKGPWRLEKLAKALDEAEVKYLWTIFTDTEGVEIDSPNVVLMKPRYDIRDYIADADWLVQLSDTEGYSYSILEALCLGTPVIVTDLPSNWEMQIRDWENAIVLPMDMSEIPILRIRNCRKGFRYRPREDNWANILK